LQVPYQPGVPCKSLNAKSERPRVLKGAHIRSTRAALMRSPAAVESFQRLRMGTSLFLAGSKSSSDSPSRHPLVGQWIWTVTRCLEWRPGKKLEPMSKAIKAVVAKALD